MKNDNKKILFIELISFAFIFLYVLVFNGKASYLPIVLINIIFTVIFIVFFGYKREKNNMTKKIFINIFWYCLLFLFFSYFLSFPFGYIKSVYVLNLIGILKNIIPIILLIVSSELFRYCIVSKKGKFHMIVITIIMIFIDVVFSIGLLRVNYDSIVMFICSYLIPSIAKNIFLTFLSYKVGFSSSILYRIILEATDYIFPIFPGFGDYLHAVVDVLFPLFLLIRVRVLLNNDNYVYKRNIWGRVLTCFFVLMTFIIILLYSGLFKYFVVAVNSDTMKDTFNKGDVIVIEKLNDLSDVDVGDILVFEYNDTIVSHRVVNIIMSDDDYYFETKGDNNSSKDNFIIGANQVKGRFLFNVPYIGWFSVWLSDIGRK